MRHYIYCLFILLPCFDFGHLLPLQSNTVDLGSNLLLPEKLILEQLGDYRQDEIRSPRQVLCFKVLIDLNHWPSLFLTENLVLRLPMFRKRKLTSNVSPPAWNQRPESDLSMPSNVTKMHELLSQVDRDLLENLLMQMQRQRQFDASGSSSVHQQMAATSLGQPMLSSSTGPLVGMQVLAQRLQTLHPTCEYGDAFLLILSIALLAAIYKTRLI